MTEAMSSAVKELYDHFNDNYDEPMVRQRNEVYKQVISENSGVARALIHARALARFFAEKTVIVRERDILAGHIQFVHEGASLPLRYPDPADPDRSVETFDPSNSANVLWDVRRERANYKELRGKDYTAEEEEIIDYLIRGIDTGLVTRWANGHVISGYDFVINQGYAALEKRLKEKRDKAGQSGRNYYDAMITAVQGAMVYIGRYEDAARKTLEKTTDPVHRKNMERIASACGHIKTEKPGSFFEAVQSLILLHEMLLYENHSGSMSLGRVDRLLGPCYEKDKAGKKIDFDEAGEIIDALWLKIASVVMGYQNVTIGGCDENGEPFENDITLLCMRASKKLKQDQPLLSLRCHKHTSDALWEETIALLSQGGGFPALFNDEVIMKAKENQGVEKKDSWNYGLVGCVEPSIGGREFSFTEELRINWAKVIELMFSGGVCTITGIDVGLKNKRSLESITGFEDFYNWFKEELRFSIETCARACSMIDSAYPLYFPSPLMSSTFEDCVEKGEDTAGNGPKYRFSTANACGMANTVDSLMAIKDMVFEKHMVTLENIAHAMAGNYEGYSELKAYALNRCPKYGNDLPEVDKYMKEIADFFCSTVMAQKNYRGGTFQAGLYTVISQATMGKITGALPDGRESGVSLANAISPVQGMDTQGPTANLRSLLQPDHSLAANGLVADLKFSPAFFDKESHRKMLRSLVETYFAEGGQEIQFNVVNRETLLEAQREPQKHRNLVVRVSGFSAYFVSLDKILQDEIIKRTEYHGI
ncbi:formate C-acetyltransferase [Spirochaetia bacterium]|nr:formate C-acetyltransferase [Spirochaetia bacterium]